MPDRILAETKYLRVIDRDGWTFVERPNASGVVAIVAVTDDGRLVLVEQFRRPLGRRVIELPAGLVGDEPGASTDLIAAAHRELIEETGYDAAKLVFLTAGPSSAGLSNEVISFFLATGLRRVGAGGGVADESIVVHTPALAGIRDWLAEREREGMMIDPKVFTGLYFLTAATA
jgi:ADP-ribose pyrophosphatase